MGDCTDPLPVQKVLYMIWQLPNQPCKSKCKSLNPPHMTTSSSHLAHSIFPWPILLYWVPWLIGLVVLQSLLKVIFWHLDPRGGHSQYILVGVCRGTSKKGGLRHGHNPKKGGLRHGQNQKKGDLMHGQNQKWGVLGMGLRGTSRKMGVLRTGLVKKTILVTDVAQQGVLGAYLLITLTFFLSTWSIVGGLLWQSKKGVLDTGQVINFQITWHFVS